MYGEKCKACGLVEGAHDVAEYVSRNNPMLNNSQTEDLVAQHLGEGRIPRQSFISEVTHEKGCPIVIDYNGREIYCQDLTGGCEELKRHP